MHHTHRRTILAGTALATMALTVSSLGVLAQDESMAPESMAPEMASTGYTELDQALNGDLAGTTVTMQTQWITAEGDDFAAALAPFQEATGIAVNVAEVPSGQHEQLINVSLNGGVAADLIVQAQPAAINAYGDAGLIKDLSTMMDVEKLGAEHPATLPLYQTEGGTWAIPYKVDVKSVVWYPIKAFEAAGYEVPTTWDELIALSDQIVADGGTPWCIGAESGPATGWVLTDWIEDIMLRTAGAQKYAGVVTRELPFDSPEMMAAWDQAGIIWFNPDYVLGGTTGILATSFLDAMDPMFNDDLQNPGCWMQKQATWYGPAQFPDVKANGGGDSKYIVGEDVGLFYFPPIDPAMGTPALGAGDGIMVTQDRPEVRALAQWLSTPAGIQGWVEKGSALSANQTTPADWYADSYKLSVANDILANADSFGFDASDLMPGTGSFWWTGVSDWVASGGADTEAVLAGIDTAWDDIEAQ
jgi:alpha-glucoside transport system substrate-binding protein